MYWKSRKASALSITEAKTWMWEEFGKDLFGLKEVLGNFRSLDKIGLGQGCAQFGSRTVVLDWEYCWVVERIFSRAPESVSHVLSSEGRVWRLIIWLPCLFIFVCRLVGFLPRSLQKIRHIKIWHSQGEHNVLFENLRIDSLLFHKWVFCWLHQPVTFSMQGECFFRWERRGLTWMRVRTFKSPSGFWEELQSQCLVWHWQ